MPRPRVLVQGARVPYIGRTMEQDDTLRVSTRERDAAVDRLQSAYIDGYLGENELGNRIEKALGAQQRSDLTVLLGDLPATRLPAVVRPEVPGQAPKGELVTVHKQALRKAGPWQVPAKSRNVVYKGELVLDLTEATLTSDRTEIHIEGYKSDVEVVVPPGVRVEVQGTSYKGDWTNTLPAGAPSDPVVILKGSLYKAKVVVRRG